LWPLGPRSTPRQLLHEPGSGRQPPAAPLRTSDDTLTPAGLAAACKQLYQAERGWRDLKGALRLRPVFHYREDRIRAHIQLCWLALLLIRTIEYQAQDTWRNIRHELDRIDLVTLQAGDGRVAQRSVTTPGQQHIFKALRLTEPARFHDSSWPSPPSKDPAHSLA